MNRLWVRLSLMISAVLFSMFFLQFLAITLDGPDQDSGPMGERPADIQGRLVGFMLFSLMVGTAGGFGIGRVVSSPVNSLVKAVQRVGNGELTVRVPVRGSLEFQELAQSFNKMAEDLQRTETLRNHLMADVSHELRTPLTVLESNLRAVLDHVYTLDEVEIATLYGQTRHLSRLVNDLRELALAEAHQLPLEKAPTDVTEIIAETLQALEPLALEKEVALRNKISQLPEATLDPLRIRQVLFNLLTNALRHTPPGGTVVLTGGSSVDMMSISVQDNGEGLEAEQLTAVFNRFYRADKSRSRDTGGSGLGLAIVKALVEQHGGRVEVRSAGRGQGCEFILWLPLG